MKFKSTRLAAALLVFSLCSLSATAQDYEIRLEDRFKVGDKYTLSATDRSRVRMKATVGGRISRETDEESRFKLTADVTILAVDGNGEATSKSFAISSTELTKDGTTTSVLPRGSVVLAKLVDGQTRFEIGGKPVAEGIARALSTVIALHSGDSTSDENMFGSRIRRRVGESWSLNVEAVMAFIKEIGGQTKKEYITGTTSLEKVEDNHFFVRGRMDVADAMLPASSPFTTEKSEIHSSFFSRRPLHGSDGSIDFEHQLTLKINAVDRNTDHIPRIELLIETSGGYRIVPIAARVTSSLSSSLERSPDCPTSDPGVARATQRGRTRFARLPAFLTARECGTRFNSPVHTQQ